MLFRSASCIEFSGTAHIKWFIISFTIKFNTGSPNQPPRLNWKQFYTEFLPDFSGGIKGEVSSSDISEKSKEPLKLARMNPQGGYLGEREKAVFPPATVILSAAWGARMQRST